MIPEAITPTVAPATDARTRYIDLLLEKAKTTVDGKLDETLLDRIEKLLALPQPTLPDK